MAETAQYVLSDKNSEKTSLSEPPEKWVLSKLSNQTPTNQNAPNDMKKLEYTIPHSTMASPIHWSMSNTRWRREAFISGKRLTTYFLLVTCPARMPVYVVLNTSWAFFTTGSSGNEALMRPSW